MRTVSELVSDEIRDELEAEHESIMQSVLALNPGIGLTTASLRAARIILVGERQKYCERETVYG